MALKIYALQAELATSHLHFISFTAKYLHFYFSISFGLRCDPAWKISSNHLFSWNEMDCLNVAHPQKIITKHVPIIHLAWNEPSKRKSKHICCWFLLVLLCSSCKGVSIAVRFKCKGVSICVVFRKLSHYRRLLSCLVECRLVAFLARIVGENAPSKMVNGREHSHKYHMG